VIITEYDLPNPLELKAAFVQAGKRFGPPPQVR